MYFSAERMSPKPAIFLNPFPSDISASCTCPFTCMDTINHSLLHLKYFLDHLFYHVDSRFSFSPYWKLTSSICGGSFSVKILEREGAHNGRSHKIFVSESHFLPICPNSECLHLDFPHNSVPQLDADRS